MEVVYSLFAPPDSSLVVARSASHTVVSLRQKENPQEYNFSDFRHHHASSVLLSTSNVFVSFKQGWAEGLSRRRFNRMFDRMFNRMFNRMFDRMFDRVVVDVQSNR